MKMQWEGGKSERQPGGPSPSINDGSSALLGGGAVAPAGGQSRMRSIE